MPGRRQRPPCRPELLHPVESSGLTIVNLKAISAAKWGDGIDHMSCSDVRIDGVFLRTSDDSVAIYGHRRSQLSGRDGDGDNNLVRNVVFEDFRIDSIEEGMLFNIRAVFNEKYGLAPGRGVENIVIRNVRFRGGDINCPVITDHSADGMVRGVTIENLEVAGKPLKCEDIDVGPFVADLVVKP